MRFFGDNLRTAWDILLELYAVQLGGRKTSLPELAQATEAPAPTVRRWVPELEQRGLAACSADPQETNQVTVKLTAQGISKMENLADHWGSAFRSI